MVRITACRVAFRAGVLPAEVEAGCKRQVLVAPTAISTAGRGAQADRTSSCRLRALIGSAVGRVPM